MKVLVLNCGSSSIKYKLYDMNGQKELASGGIEKIGLPDSFLKFTLSDGSKQVITQEIKEHTAGIELILKTLTDAKYGVIKSLDQIDAVGHRVVHGGDKFCSSVVINQEVINKIRLLRKIRCPSLWLPRYVASLCGKTRLRISGSRPRKLAYYHRTHRQRRLHHRYQKRQVYRYVDGYDACRRAYDGLSKR